MTNRTTGVPSIPMYAVGIQKSIVAGDLAQMKALAIEAEQYLREHGDVSAALEALKIEIAKLERKT